MLISNFISHPVTKGVKKIAIGTGCSLSIESPAIVLAYGNRTTTADSQTGTNVVILAAAEYEKGRILAIGDTDFLIGEDTETVFESSSVSEWFSRYDNKMLALNMFEWVTQIFPPSPDITEADTLSSEGYILFSQREYSLAKLKFEEALSIYSDANVIEKISEMQEMIEKCIKGLDAEVAYQKGTEYHEKGEYENALAEFQESKLLYDEIEDTIGYQQAQSMIDICNNVIDATGFIHGTVYWNTTMNPAKNVAVKIYDEATDLLEKTVQTDSQGRFVAEIPKNKSYYIIVEIFIEQKQFGIIPVDSLDTGALILIIVNPSEESEVTPSEESEVTPNYKMISIFIICILAMILLIISSPSDRTKSIRNTLIAFFITIIAGIILYYLS